MGKEEIEIRENEITLRLLAAQRQLAGSKKAALVLIDGPEKRGKVEAMQKLLEWCDARGVETIAFSKPTLTEKAHPRFWRYWQKLPMQGRMAIFFDSWYAMPYKKKEIEKFEAMLKAEGVILIKLWVNIKAKNGQTPEIIKWANFVAQSIELGMTASVQTPNQLRWHKASRQYLAELDLAKKLEREDYEAKLKKYSKKIEQGIRKMSRRGKSLVVVFEGPDAAGKGGAIRRVIRALDPRLYQVHAISAPTDAEKGRPYLWRFWVKTPDEGKVAIFDRSWYGRVLVERIEKFCSDDEWQRAYSEINDFERSLAESRTHVIKFYLSTSSEEQLRRFRDRKTTPYKQYKLTEEDWRNRDKWNAYQEAASDMIENTDTGLAPWVLVEADDKYYARIKVMRAIAKLLAD